MYCEAGSRVNKEVECGCLQAGGQTGIKGTLCYLWLFLLVSVWLLFEVIRHGKKDLSEFECCPFQLRSPKRYGCRLRNLFLFSATRWGVQPLVDIGGLLPPRGSISLTDHKFSLQQHRWCQCDKCGGESPLFCYFRSHVQHRQCLVEQYRGLDGHKTPFSIRMSTDNKRSATVSFPWIPRYKSVYIKI